MSFAHKYIYSRACKKFVIPIFGSFKLDRMSFTTSEFIL